MFAGQKASSRGLRFRGLPDASCSLTAKPNALGHVKREVVAQFSCSLLQGQACQTPKIGVPMLTSGFCSKKHKLLNAGDMHPHSSNGIVSLRCITSTTSTLTTSSFARILHIPRIRSMKPRGARVDVWTGLLFRR